MTDAPLTDTTPSEAPRSSKRTTRVIFEWVAVLLVAAVASITLRTFVFETYYIPSGSMEPTLQIGDRIVVNKLSVDFGTINRGDVIVFKSPPSENCGGPPVADLVKRVIGLPGDHLTSVGNTIYVNGKALRENWPHTEPLGTPIGHVTVPAGHYFMMGDNHADSCDSRMWGTITRSEIIGKVFIRIWPLGRLGFL
ncbi:MAG: signal peptidase I [Acidobacteria bacterium]|nr:signal peptidase I [Acidobacteriota bacterium]